MKLTASQTAAIDKINRWLLSSGSDPFVLAGYAGTGKTTLLQEFINAQNNPVLCCAPTGKAASVLGRRLTNARVTTIHSAIYKPNPPSMVKLDALMGELQNNPNDPALLEAVALERAMLSDKRINFTLKEDRTINAGQLVVIDESSMVTRRMQADLARTNAKVLYVGDPGQLPPVMDEGFFRHHPPDIMLKEVLRQALDSPIIRLSMAIREDNLYSFDYGRYVGDGEVTKISKADFPGPRWLEYDQVITGTNVSRRRINRYFRAQKYAGAATSWWPITGDKLICLRNENESGVYYINGVLASALSNGVFNEDFGTIGLDLLYENQVIKDSPVWRYPFQIHYDPQAKEDLHWDREGMRQFDYAYAITVHKSQGSEWDRVILADDGMMADQKEFRKLWLYTAVTRAKKELVWLY